MAANPFISNGTCYYEAGEEADPSFIPCGNDALGHKTCCQAGDMCLSSKACFNLKYMLTYLAGCSDPDYLDESCPQKPGLDGSPWVGLATCKDTNLWTACTQQANPTTIQKPDSCTCTATAPTAAFTDAPTLTNIAALPTVLGGSVIWQQGFLPTSTTSSSTSASANSSSSSSSTSSSLVPAITVPPTAASSSSSPALTAQPLADGSAGMSTGTKAGIGAGVTIAVLFILAGIAALLLLRRRRRRTALDALQHQVPDDHGMEPKYAWSPSTVATTRISELDSRAARPWSMRTELEGTDSSPRSIGAAFEGAKNNDGGSDGLQVPKAQPQDRGAFAELQG